MYVSELWRYPVKSLRGVRLDVAEVTLDGIACDRQIVVVSESRQRVITARTHYRLLGLQGSLGSDRAVLVNGVPWDSPEARQMVSEAACEPVRLVETSSPQRFDILPLLVTTDGAVKAMGVDGRRFRPNIVIGAVDGLTEREWPGKRLVIGEVEIDMRQLRDRCVMTTYDPDSLEQDVKVLKKIVREREGHFGLDSAVIKSGVIREGDEVRVL